MSYVIEPNDRAEIERLDREDREEIARNQLCERYANEWLDAVTNEPLNSFVCFDKREVYNPQRQAFESRESTVAELFHHQYDYGDFCDRVAQLVIDAHKSGNQDATKLLGEMAVSFGEGKV